LKKFRARGGDMSREKESLFLGIVILSEYKSVNADFNNFLKFYRGEKFWLYCVPEIEEIEKAVEELSLVCKKVIILSRSYLKDHAMSRAYKLAQKRFPMIEAYRVPFIQK
jgi:hypothetical protein